MFSFQAGRWIYSTIISLENERAIDFIEGGGFLIIDTCTQTIHVWLEIILRAAIFYGVIYINYVAINDTYETKSTLAISL